MTEILKTLQDLRIDIAQPNQQTSEKMDTLEKHVQDLAANVAALSTSLAEHLNKTKTIVNPKTQATSTVSASCEHDDARRLASAKSARSIKGLMNDLPNWSFHYKTEEDKNNKFPDGLYCSSCSDLKDGVGLQTHSTGVVHYNFDNGQDFTYSRNLPQSFRNLKTHVSAHMSSAAHNENVRKERKLDEIRKTPEFVAKSLKRGRTLGLNAYKAISLNKSQKSFEDEIAADFAKGYDVGTKNHSRKFAEAMTHSFYHVLEDQLQKNLEEPLPGSLRPSAIHIKFDKYTPNRYPYSFTLY